MNTHNTEQESQEKIRNTKRPDISVVKDSFRRIAGIREFADSSGTFKVRIVEILREPGKSLGFYIQQGDGWEREDGVFVSRVNLGSIMETNGLLSIGDEITRVNDIDVTQMPLEKVAVIMRYVKRLFLTVKVLTSPTLVRTYSTQQANSTDGEDNVNLPSQLKSFNFQQKVAHDISPSTKSKRKVVVTDGGGVEPYAYTRIGWTQDEGTVNSDYCTITHQPLIQLRDCISTESLHTSESRHSEELSMNVIDYENIDQSLDVQSYSGQLKLILHTIDNLIPISDDSPLVCTVLCDSELRLELPIPANELDETEVKISHEYHIQLSLTHRINFKLVNGLLSSIKTIPLSFFIPLTQKINTTRSTQEFGLILNPIGQLRFTLEFCPLPAAIPRWSNPTNTNISLKEAVLSNPSNSGLPLVLERTIQVIEEYGIETVGLYQITANQDAKMEALTACLSDTLQPSHLHSLVPQLTVHAFTGVLIDFFFNLPEPLFSSDFTTTLQDAMAIPSSTEEEQSSSIQTEQTILSNSFIECLPDHIHATTYALLIHFRNVCQYGSINKTTVDKISQMFAPLLFIPTHHEREYDNDDYTSHAKMLKTIILQQK